MKEFFIVFISVFLAELGDKTQIATLLFASEKNMNKYIVFLGAAAALTATSAIGVLIGDAISGYINQKYLNYAAGAGFIAIGVFLFFSK